MNRIDVCDLNRLLEIVMTVETQLKQMELLGGRYGYGCTERNRCWN